MAHITLRVKLGPLVSFEITGQSCKELSSALEGFQTLNQQIDELCSDLAERVYPEGQPAEGRQDGEEAT
jgi:hypothetical protein